MIEIEQFPNEAILLNTFGRRYRAARALVAIARREQAGCPVFARKEKLNKRQSVRGVRSGIHAEHIRIQISLSRMS